MQFAPLGWVDFVACRAACNLRAVVVPCAGKRRVPGQRLPVACVGFGVSGWGGVDHDDYSQRDGKFLATGLQILLGITDRRARSVLR